MRRLWHYQSVGCAAAVSFGNSQRPALCAGRMHSFSKEACSHSFDVDSNDASVCSLRALLPQAHVSEGRCRQLTPLRIRIFVSHRNIPTAVAFTDHKGEKDSTTLELQQILKNFPRKNLQPPRKKIVEFSAF